MQRVPALRPPSQCQTARRAAWFRAALLVPAAHFLRPGCCLARLCLHRVSAALPALRRGSRPNPWRQLQLRPRYEGPAERREAYLPKSVALRRARPHACEAWAVPRIPGRAASRRSTVALSAQEPLRIRTICGIRPEGCSRPAMAYGGLRPRAFRPRLCGPQSTPLPAPPAGSSPETPLMSEDGESILQLRYEVNR
jgi:hypothetical protein